jgi:hypothetical protein
MGVSRPRGRHRRHRPPSVARRTLELIALPSHEGGPHGRTCANANGEEDVLRRLTLLEYWVVWTRIEESGATPLQALTTSKDDFVSGKKTWIRRQLWAVIVVCSHGSVNIESPHIKT